jgi:hypothetical protein
MIKLILLSTSDGITDECGLLLKFRYCEKATKLKKDIPPFF